jgi:hypothetical protein
MAWRIDEHVIRGEIDNRVRGRVTGRIWLEGRAEPVELNLIGNAWRDLAGRRLEFVNPAPKSGLDGSFAAQQRGPTGDITASRKVKVPEIPLDQIAEYYAARKPWPWHWGNSLYLEWFGLPNGRIVIESATFQLTLSPDSTWEMTPEEETSQREANAAALNGFMERISEANKPGRCRDVDDEQPLTEKEAEKMQAQSERLVDRIIARMEREGGTANYAKIVAEEVERARRERNEPDPTPAQETEQARWIEEMNAASAEALELEKSESWKRSANEAGNVADDSHPLSARAFELSVRVMREPQERGWLPVDASREHPVAELAASVAKAGAKLAGALDGDDWPPPLEFCALVLVRLKRAAGYLEDALLAAQSCREESLTEPAWLAEVTREAAAIGAETNTLIEKLRTRLKDRK